MAGVIFIDSNVPMYLIGAPHPLKVDAQRVLEQLVTERTRLVTDAEVLQEILHRYTAIRRTEAIQPAFDALLNVVDEVYTIDLEVMERAKRFVQGKSAGSARDAIHAAVMELHKVQTIFSFDRHFDAIPGLTRLYQ
jgi:predicted nucleic acid-binding protein